MEYRYPKFNALGSIDMEINHSVHGWVPFTASQRDTEALGRQLYASTRAIAAPYASPPEPTIEERRAAMPSITPRQLRLTLQSIGITEDAIEAVLVNDPEGKIEWKWATTFSRKHPLINTMGAVFSITPEQIDDLWVFAKAI
ncbi:hypothetical protein [Mesorhizobium sp. M1403]|uniref:hypothetical protein n=1 Tax=Mesorhizobium sp. M1403 TaxID=2957097 RepID=UPI0033391127